ncbi:MAG: nucleotidyltransferase domain-containing protein [Halobacteriota archaeon]
MIEARIRDFIITKDDWIFAVADYFHPEGVRCVLRYVPDESGDRQLNGVNYLKYDFDVAFDFMKENRPEWVQDVHIVPEDQIKKVLHPSDPISELVKQDERVKAVADVLLSAGIPIEKMGVTGSFLPGLQNEQSDVDFVVYGNDWFKARDAIADAKKEGGFIEDIDDQMWHRIYNKRIPEISYEEFVLHEKRKGNRGMVGGTYFDLLFVRDRDQIGDPLPRGIDIGTMKVEGRVTDATFAFDNPSVYMIENDEVDHVLSYTHTYAGQVLEGEIIEAQGVVEKVDGIKRLVVGTSREPKGEWIRSLTLLEKGH